jgi:hypothetical protein
MPRSRALVVLTAAFALLGAVSLGMTGIADAGPSATVLRPELPAPTSTAGQTWTTAADTITIDPVVQVTPASSNGQAGEILSVTADSTTPLTSMTVHLLGATSDQDVLDLAMSAPANPPASGPSTWTSPLVSQAGGSYNLQLGTYNVAADAADQGGASVSYQPAGTFAFQDTVSITPNPADLLITHDNPTPTISGTVSTLAPGATTAQPYADEQIMLEDSVLGDVPLTTNPTTGAYSYTFAHPQPGEIFGVVVQPTSSLAGGATVTGQFDAQTDPVALSAGLSATTVTYGGKVTVGGTLTYQPGASYEPLSHQTVRIYNGPGTTTPVATVTTSATGTFTATLPKEATSVRWVVQAGGPAASQYLGSASLTLPMKVNLPTAVSGFGVALSVTGQLSFRGCLTLTAGVPGGVPSLSGLAMQYSAGSKGPWRSLGSLPKQTAARCGNGGWKFSGTLGAKLNYAYYRAWYPGTTAAGTGYLAAASGSVLQWKYEDRITGFSVSAKTVHTGGLLTVDGQLQYYSGKWLDYANQPVYIILRAPGRCANWCYLVVPSTNSGGRFSVTFADPQTATWSALFLGNSTHLATQAATSYVTVS